ncbi:MAG: RNA polymerase sporulation sigma factor SigK [Firmicutes bacterium]|jgi:RNA polymerase sigma-K factor|nr:RNA polymerase sporulation sigma factor SigK [Bacillota bacterium]
MFWELIYLFGSLVPGMGFLLGYLNSNAFPKPLEPEAERQYLQAWAEGDKNARLKLIEHNLRLVAHIVKKFENSGPDREDLISIGTIGLIKAINTFDLNKKIKLTTYAAKCIENEVLMFLRSTKNARTEVSLNDSIGSDKEGNQITLLETLGSDGTEILETVESKDDERLLHLSLKTLSPKERYIIIQRYGLCGAEEHTQREIAKQLGISRSYVSRIEKKALQKLHKSFEE